MKKIFIMIMTIMVSLVLSVNTANARGLGGGPGHRGGGSVHHGGGFRHNGGGYRHYNGGYRHHRHHRHHSNWWPFLGGMLVGGALGYNNYYGYGYSYPYQSYSPQPTTVIIQQPAVQVVPAPQQTYSQTYYYYQ